MGDAVMCPAFVRGAMTAGPDEVRTPSPSQTTGLERPDKTSGFRKGRGAGLRAARRPESSCATTPPSRTASTCTATISTSSGKTAPPANTETRRMSAVPTEVCDTRPSILPSGAKRYFIHSQHHGRRVWKIVGQVGAIGADEARARAKALLAAIREGNDGPPAAPPDTAFETVGEEVFRRYARNWKTSTLQVNRGHYRNHILPWFKGRPIDDITNP